MPEEQIRIFWSKEGYVYGSRSSMKSSQYELVVEREEAIQKAINMATQKDIVLIAGKGHETYQILNDKTVPFDDKAIAKEAMIKYQSKRK